MPSFDEVVTQEFSSCLEARRSLKKSGNLIGPIIVEPKVDETPPEFIAVGRVYQTALELSPQGRSWQFRRELRREFHRLLDVTINEVIRKRRV